jgi:hypothetical protein
MSLPTSRHTPTFAEHRDSLREAVVDVAESSFFAFVDPCDRERFAELSHDVRSWIQASVLFEGAFGGAVLVVVTEPLANELFSAFLGADPEVVAAEGALFDLLGEFANMISGHWLTQACQRGPFDLHHPEVARLPADQVRPDANDCVLVAINDQPCLVRLAYSEDGRWP